MKLLKRTEAIALVPALQKMGARAQEALEAHILKGRIRPNDEGLIDIHQLETLWALDKDNAPKDDAAKADLIGKSIERLEGELEALRSKATPLLAELEMLRKLKAEFVPPAEEPEEEHEDKKTTKEAHPKMKPYTHK